MTESTTKQRQTSWLVHTWKRKMGEWKESIWRASCWRTAGHELMRLNTKTYIHRRTWKQMLSKVKMQHKKMKNPFYSAAFSNSRLRSYKVCTGIDQITSTTKMRHITRQYDWLRFSYFTITYPNTFIYSKLLKDVFNFESVRAVCVDDGLVFIYHLVSFLRCLCISIIVLAFSFENLLTFSGLSFPVVVCLILSQLFLP